MKWIYTLRLINNKFYVGYTDNLDKRMCEHFTGNGSLWTKKYVPIDVYHVEIEKHRWHEDFNTLRLMREYDLNNVRGGRWCQVTNLSFTPKHLYDIDIDLDLESNIKRIGSISDDWKEKKGKKVTM